MKLPAMTQSSMRLLLTSHSWEEERTGETNLRCTCRSVVVPAMLLCSTVLWQSHLYTKTPELSSKAIQKKAVIATSEHRQSITEKYLAVGCRFLAQARYSCHLKSGDSYMPDKIWLGKTPKSQYKNYSKWRGMLQHRCTHPWTLGVWNSEQEILYITKHYNTAVQLETHVFGAGCSKS